FIRCTSTATHTIYPLSLHDALPIFRCVVGSDDQARAHDECTLPERRDHEPLGGGLGRPICLAGALVLTHRKHGVTLHLGNGVVGDRKSTRLNSSHVKISYAVFCLKK